ncbi:MAG TPA: prolyl oligopeptidase family serine peptidase [Opitutus sp.]|nr:prolyl oligopeptidase family serine peptidase [Opitutus sp.]
MLLAAGTLVADEGVDLKRITPVPATEQIPIADFFRPQYMQAPTINPGGTRVAALVAGGEDKRNLLVYDLASHKTDLLTSTDVTDTYRVAWLNDTRLIFGLRFYQTFGGGLYATEAGHLTDRWPLLQYVAPELLAIPQSNRTRPLASMVPNTLNTGQQGEAVVMNTDIRTGKVINMLSVVTDSLNDLDIREDNQKVIENRYVGPTDGYYAGFMPDKDGKIAFAFTAKDGAFTMYRWDDTHWEKCPVNLDDVDVVGFGRTHDEVIVVGPRQDGRPRALQFMDAATGKLGEVLLQDKGYTYRGWLYYQPGSHALLGANYDRNGPAEAWFNEDYAKLQKVLEGYFPKLIVRLIDADEAGRMLLVETYSDRQPPIYYSVDLEKKSLGEISKSQPWIDPKRMRPVNIMPFKTRDGKTIDAYVTLPPGVSKQNPAPLIVLPPDVPQMHRADYNMNKVRVTWGYDADAQFFASRGYAVLRPNHRGSAGYGWMFPAEDQWAPAKMADDIAAATRHLVASGLVDKSRIGILGSDLAGYLAVAAAEADPELFRAIVTFQGIYDWPAYMKSLKFNQYTNPNYGVLARHLNDQQIAAMSVGDRLRGLHSAVLVGYQREAGDMTSQSTGFASDLERAGVPHETIGIGNERSTLNLLHNRVEIYSRALEFLDKYLHPTPVTAEAK